MRIVLFGDGAWAAETLRTLRVDGHHIAAVVGRRKPTDGALESEARRWGLEYASPDRVNAYPFVELVRRWVPELNLSFSYDQIIRHPLLGAAPLGFLNCHAGMLPRYRGRNVVNWALANGEREIGLTIHYLDEGIDTGDLLVQEALSIAWEDDYGSLLRKIRKAFPGLVRRALTAIDHATAVRRPQPHEGEYWRRRGPGDEDIDWTRPSVEVYNLIRAVSRPGPGARTWDGRGRERIVWRAAYELGWPRVRARPGVVLPGEGGSIRVATADSTILLQEVRDPEGRPVPMRAGERLEGRP